MTTPAQRGSFELGPINGNCLEAWATPESVQNAHDLGNRPIYEAPTNSNAQHLAPAPEANR
jgi:hypothetical protein